MDIEGEYEKCIRLLEKAGIINSIQNSQRFGMIVIDGAEYPVPSQEQVNEIFTRNEELVERKTVYGVPGQVSAYPGLARAVTR